MNVAPSLAALVALSAGAVAAQSILPEALPAGRYEKLIESSPFALATAAEPVKEAGPGPFAHLYVAAVAQLKDATGKVEDVVTIKSRSDQTSFTLAGTEAKDGFQIATIEWSDRVAATKVTLKKGSEFGTIEFDQANAKGPPQPPPGPSPRPGQGPGGIAIPGANQLQRPGARLPVVPRPTTVAPVATPQVANPQPAGAQGTATPANANDRPRRVRVIKSNP